MSEAAKEPDLQFPLEVSAEQSCVSVNPDVQFRKACSRFPTGVTVTTGVRADGKPFGVTVSSFTSVSLDPPLVLICIDHRSRALRNLLAGQCFGVNVLNENQQEISIRFARNSNEQFSNISWYWGKTGVPLLEDVSATFECRLTEAKSAGDHVIIIGQVLHMVACELAPLAYVNSSYARVYFK